MYRVFPLKSRASLIAFMRLATRSSNSVSCIGGSWLDGLGCVFATYGVSLLVLLMAGLILAVLLLAVLLMAALLLAVLLLAAL